MTRRSFAQVSGVAFALGLSRRVKAADTYSSSEGQLSVALEARLGYHSVGNRTVQVLTYNGQMPGPVLELRAGDTLRIRFRNSLDEPTNLHFHGLHVSPNGNSDNAFAMVPRVRLSTTRSPFPRTIRPGLSGTTRISMA